MKKDLTIIGAGLSGLYSAYLLQDDFNITILEARDRIGGRVLTESEHDLGPSWIWSHQKHILSLLNELDLNIFSQYTKGDALYHTDKTQRFNPPPSAPSARVEGGLFTLIQKLYDKSLDVNLCLKTEVLELVYKDEKIKVITNDKTYIASYVLNTLPPRISSELKYEPILEKEKLSILQNTPTWMGQSKKVVVEYEKDFWRSENLSGFVFSHSTPLGEIHDATTKDKPALFGFVSAKYDMKNIQEDTIKQLVDIFGIKAKEFTNIYVLDWTKQKFTSSVLDKQTLSAHPQYGYDIKHFDAHLFFIGSESSYDNGGYLEGALVSAKDVAKELLQKS